MLKIREAEMRTAEKERKAKRKRVKERRTKYWEMERERQSIRMKE
jgi:hypothetical protein